MTDIQATPAKIAAAIIAVKKQVKQLGSDERNQHGGYNYVSVDKFYERIGPMMADVGLALLIDETETEVRVTESTDRNGQARKTPWLFAQYSLAFMHEGGETSAPMHRSLAMPITGPQTYGAAQSYIEKQFLRQVFKIPTGEKDADETAQDQEAPARPRPQTNGATRAAAAPTPPERPAHVNGAALPPHPEEDGATTQARQRVRMLIDRLNHSIKEAKNSVALDTLWTSPQTEDDLKEIGGAGSDGAAAASTLRSKYARRIDQLKDAESRV